MKYLISTSLSLLALVTTLTAQSVDVSGTQQASSNNLSFNQSSSSDLFNVPNISDPQFLTKLQNLIEKNNFHLTPAEYTQFEAFLAKIHVSLDHKFSSDLQSWLMHPVFPMPNVLLTDFDKFFHDHEKDCSLAKNPWATEFGKWLNQNCGHQSVPEPGTLALVAIGAGLFALHLKKRRAGS